MNREPAVSGLFYPKDAGALKKEVSSYLHESKKIAAKGILCPHAGYVYSGKVAGSVYSSINVPQDIIIIGPNHTGMGAPAAIMTSGTWVMPGGNVDIAVSLASAVLGSSSYLREDYLAHLNEHSLEVHIPFLQACNKEISIVPLAMMSASIEKCIDVGHAIADAILKYEKPVLIVASSDMSHYESDSSARMKDKKAIEKMLAMDPEGLLRTVRSSQISMCGVIPAVIMMYACMELGATEARLIEYATSGEVSRDYESVVGYAGMIFT